MRELIFSLNEIFDTGTPAGCLSQYDASCYHIPAYQRGYKWSSEVNGAVPVLLKDLEAAFQSAESEYYLQYITVKRKPLENSGQYCLEVIDGQQRLTTLSVLLSVLSALDKQDNIAREKLHYAVRSHFFSEHIYPAEQVLELAKATWDEWIAAYPQQDRQDIYHLHGAVRACYRFLKDRADRDKFHDYILRAVKLIVNSVEPHIQSETVFRNLNSNKVPLTEAELIKGLLITRAGRRRVKQSESHFREVMEVRLGIGKDWERIQRWARQPSICTFFFNGAADGMPQLLELTAMALEGDAEVGASPKRAKKAQHYGLFEFYNQLKDADRALAKLLEVQQRLAAWFENDFVYHRMGFCRFVKGSKLNTLDFLRDCLNEKTHSALKTKLNKQVRELISINPKDGPLMYGQHDEKIHAVLLALSVFHEQEGRARFDFDAFSRQQWSLEHIFPRTPEGKDQKLDETGKKNIRQLLQEATKSQVSDEVEAVLQLDTRDANQRLVYERALEETGRLHTIGNMCLLAGNDNSAIGNKFFNEKRQAILQRIQWGSFVPKHTFDVFSKMFGGAKDDLKFWYFHDIEAHAEHIKASLQTILERVEL